jgi:hypothetical protein
MLINLYVPNFKPKPLYQKMNCNVHFINKLSKQNLVNYALNIPKWLQFYEIISTINYSQYLHMGTCIHHWMSMNYGKP